MSKRIHIVTAEQLAQEIEMLVGKRGCSSILTEAASKEVRQRRMLKTLDETSGFWRKRGHMEPNGGAARYVERFGKKVRSDLPL